MRHPRDERGPGPVHVSVPMRAVLDRLGIDVAPPEPAPRPLEPMMSITDIAEYLCVDRRTIERLRASGRFPKPCITVGRLPRWSPRTVREWAERGGR